MAKFGGSVLDSPQGYLDAAVTARLLSSQHPLVAVVSAAKGVTDLLLSSFDARKPSGAEHAFKVYGAIASSLSGRGGVEELLSELSILHSELAKLFWAAEVLGSWYPRVRDLVVSYGERFSASIFSWLLRSMGIKSRWLTGGEAGILTDDSFGEASPLYGVFEEEVAFTLEPLLREGVVPVVAGFMGSTRRGDTTLLGRGGSDLTASLIAVALGASRIDLYTDVSGVLTGDPSLVEDARSVKTLSYEEAWEVSRLGLRKFHPRTFEPLIALGAGIEVRVGSLKGGYTSITPRGGGPPVKVVTMLRSVVAVRLRGPSMAGKKGFLAGIAGLLAGSDVNILSIRQPPSETVIEMLLEKGEAGRALEVLKRGASSQGVSLEVSGTMDLVSIVGSGVGEHEVLAKVLKISRSLGSRLVSTGDNSPSISVLARPGTSGLLAKTLHREVVSGWTG